MLQYSPEISLPLLYMFVLKLSGNLGTSLILLPLYVQILLKPEVFGHITIVPTLVVSLSSPDAKPAAGIYIIEVRAQ